MDCEGCTYISFLEHRSDFASLAHSMRSAPASILPRYCLESASCMNAASSIVISSQRSSYLTHCIKRSDY